MSEVLLILENTGADLEIQRYVIRSPVKHPSPAWMTDGSDRTGKRRKQKSRRQRTARVHLLGLLNSTLSYLWQSLLDKPIALLIRRIFACIGRSSNDDISIACCEISTPAVGYQEIM